MEGQESPALVKTLRPYHVWALGVGIVLVGEYMGWNFTVAKGGILGSLLALIVAGTMYVMVSLCASELGASTKLAGGPYDWARLFVGPGAAALVGLAVYMEYIALEAADAIVVASVIQAIFPSADIQVFPMTLIVIAFLTFMNYRGVVAALNLNFALTFTALIAIIVFFFMNISGFGGQWHPEYLISGAIPNGFVGIFAALQFGPWFYLGIEGAAMCAEECKHPTRAIPLGQQAGMITLLLAAGMTLYVCSGLVPDTDLGVSAYPLYEAASNSGVTLLIALLAIGTLFTCLASANGTVCDSSRSWFALSRDHFLTPWFSAIHPKYNTPYRAVIFTMPIAIAFAFSGYLDQVITFSITSGLVCYVLIPFSLIQFRRMFPHKHLNDKGALNVVRPFAGPLQPGLAWFTIILAVIIMSTLNWGYNYNLVFGLVFYVIAYFYFSWRYRSLEVHHDWGEDMGWPDPVGAE